MAHSDILSQPDRGLGLDRPQTEALLALFSRCDDLREFGREVIQSVVNALMDSQAQEACGAPRGSRSPERVNSRNGYRERSLSTSLGDLELRVPKLREGTYFPEGILERYTRVEASMVALVREMYVAGVSTRKVGLVAEELGVSSLSSSEVSALCAGLDEEAEAFRTRPIEGEHPYVWLDATYMKCRTGGRYASVALVTAIGMSSSGHKEFLGCACFDSESEAAWSEFLGSLRDRGLRGVRLAVSDAHAGLVAAVSRVLPGCSWQRCLTHLQRDIRGHVHSLAGQAFAADLVRACAGQADADVARAAWDLAAPRVRALSRAAGVDWQHLFGRFREGQPRFPELDRRHVAQRRVDPEVVVPVHVVRELGPELARRAERLAVDELGLQYPVGRLVDGVVVGAALGRQRPLYAEGLEHQVDLGVVELAAAVRVEYLDVRDGEGERRERRLDQPGVLPGPGGVADDLPVVEVDEQADVVPRGPDAHVGQVAAYMGARRPAAEAARDDVGHVGLVDRPGVHLEPLPAVCADQAVLPHDAADPAPADGDARPLERRLYLARAVPALAGGVGRDHGRRGGVRRVGPVGPRAHGVVRRPRDAEEPALR